MKRASSAVLETTGDCQHTKPKGNPMKRKASILGALAVLAGLLLASTPASAATYICDNDTGPGTKFPAGKTEASPQSGSVEITFTGNCTINNPIAATGNVTITITNGTLDTKALISTTGALDVVSTNNNITVDGVIKTGSTIRMRAGLVAGGATGAIEVKDDITSNLVQTGTGKGMMLLKAQGNIKTKSIKSTGNAGAGSAKTAGIQIDANLYGGNTLFTIGADTSNGINGTIDTRTTTGGGTSASFIEGGVRITNGNASSTGGITVTSMSNILVQASDSKSGFIILNAQNGTLTLPTGTLNAAGASGKRAGAIHLLANTVQADDGTIISASQDSGVAGTMHQVIVAATDIKFKGTNGLEILANGDGASWSQRGTLYVLPKGGLTISSTGDAPNYSVNNLVWTASLPNFGTLNSVVNFDGTGTGSDTAPLTIKANGNYNQLFISGRPITFDGGSVTIQTRGSSASSPSQFDNQLWMGFAGTYSNEDGLVFNGTGNVIIDANGVNGNAGQVDIFVEKYALNATGGAAPTFQIKADAPSSGTANGGKIRFFSTYGATLNALSKALITANGPTSGTGHGGYVEFRPASAHITLGSDDGEYQLAAKSGTTGTGHGGEVKAITGGTLTLDSANAASVSAQGTNGNGGKLTLDGSPIVFNGTGLTLNADGGSSTGDGGEIHVYSRSGTLKVDNVANGIIVSAKAPGTGDGGLIDIGYAPTLNLSGSYVHAKAEVNGRGGHIFIHDIGSLSFMDTGGTTLNADGSGANAEGGQITLDAANAITIGSGSTGKVTLFARGNQNGGTGSGGAVNVKSTGSSVTLDSAAYLSVAAGSDGNGGAITLDGTPVNFGGTGLTLIANGGSSSGDGGEIHVLSHGATLTLSPLVANGLVAQAKALGSTGNGGTIEFGHLGVLNVRGANIDVAAKGGNGGTINIHDIGIITFLDTGGTELNADAVGSGDGGSITVHANNNFTVGSGNDTVKLFARATVNSGNGGTVSLRMDDPLNTFTINGAQIDVSSGVDGAGGNITISTPENLSLTGAFRANGSGTGPGGIIFVEANEVDLAAASTTFEADAGSGGAWGGFIQINSYVEVVDLTSAFGDSFLARGSGSEAGGYVIISKVTEFDVNHVIKVDGGSSNTNFDGSISLNLVTCEQFPTGLTYPEKFWNCTGNNPPSGQDLIPAEVANNLTNNHASLSANNTVIYVFPSAAEYNLFWSDNQDPPVGGSTFKELQSGAPTQYLYVNPFQAGNLGDNAQHTYSPNEYSEVSAHELGHAVDITDGTLSRQTAYNGYVLRDLQNLDYVVDTTVFPNVLIPRLPCSSTQFGNLTFSTDAPPFAGLSNPSTGNPICVNGALNQTDLNAAQVPIPTRNSGVLQFFAAGVWQSSPWVEVVAQTFAFQETGAQGAHPVQDGVFSKAAGLLGGTYFGCVKAWANTQRAGATPPPSVTPDACAAPDPGYVPFQ